eukprot:gb/GECH01000136.1/.p1 GENE.gb/GECH01000136.1/~~gb/GECH01000136.1/.p1  ORF type:complete len:133 (+),score=31.16 gb/GECH01000136.1/:1-399(+)
MSSIGDNEVKKLAQVIPELPQLKHFTFSIFWKVSVTIGKRLFEAISNHPSLRSISTRFENGNEFEIQPMVDHFATHLSSNTTLIEWDWYSVDCQINTEIIDQILERNYINPSTEFHNTMKWMWLSSQNSSLT